MKEMPQYLDEIVDFMAEQEEATGGLKKDEARKLFKKELIEESLTAKANPGKKTITMPVNKVVDQLLEQGFSPTQTHEKLKSMGYRASLKAIEKHAKNPRKSAGHSPEEFDQRALCEGTLHEMEHTDSFTVAQRIAMDHLVEDPEYYTKLKKMEASGNPWKPAVSELSKVWRSTFDNSPLGRALTEEERNEFWRDIELFFDKFVSRILFKTMGMKKGKDSSLAFPSTRTLKSGAITRGEFDEEAAKVQFYRYHKLFVTSFLMSMLQYSFFLTSGNVAPLLNALERRKDWHALARMSNREAHARAVNMGMRAVLGKNPINQLLVWLNGNTAMVQEVYAKAAKEQAKIDAKRGEIGKEKLENLRKKKPEELV